MKTDDPLKKVPPSPAPAPSPEDADERAAASTNGGHAPHDGTWEGGRTADPPGRRHHHPAPGKEQYSLEKLVENKQAALGE